MRKMFGVAILVILVLLMIGNCSNSGNQGDNKIDAWVFAQNTVESKLKSPGTAKFPRYSSSFVTDLGSNKYRIKSYVDAQNSFGALIRENFIVELEITGKYSYKVTKFNFY